MTGTNLFQKTPFSGPMADLPLCCLDVGSRGGIEPDLLPAAFAIDAVGFEPDQAECDRLNQGSAAPWRSARFLPTALAGDTGTHILHMTQDPISSSLLPPRRETGERFNQTAYCSVVGEIPVETLTLDDAVDRFDLPAPDYFKLDTEGLELEILRGAENALKTVSVVKTEVGFMEFREGQSTARSLDEFMATRGFELMTIISPYHWRRHGHVLHPRMGCDAIPYSRGQLAQGDFLYMRHPDAFASDLFDRDTIVEQRLKAAWIAMIYGYFDRAEEYLADPDVERLVSNKWQLECAEALRQTSRKFGRFVWRRSLFRQILGLVRILRNAPAMLAR